MARVTDTRDKLLQAALRLVWEEGVGSASVDDICDKAEVRKGSFYHFFKSKNELVMAALEAHWDETRVQLDRIFSPSMSAVDRLKGFFEFMVESQALMQKQAGRVLGCPYGSVGVSCSSEEQMIRERVEQIFGTFKKYFETALRDGRADGSIQVKDIPSMVDTVFEFIEGGMTTARIQNSLKPVQNMGRGVFTLLGLEWESKKSAASKA